MKTFKQIISENEEKVISHYNIIHHASGKVVGKAMTKNGARKSLDNHDNKYGSYAHRILPIYK